MTSQPAVPIVKDGGLAELRTALSILCGGAPAVAQSLVEIAVHGKSEMARMYAAQAVLDRVGIAPKMDIGVRVSLADDEDSIMSGPRPSDILRGRLSALEQSGFTVIDGDNNGE
jgi:hypothetical protein